MQTISQTFALFFWLNPAVFIGLYEILNFILAKVLIRKFKPKAIGFKIMVKETSRIYHSKTEKSKSEHVKLLRTLKN